MKTRSSLYRTPCKQSLNKSLHKSLSKKKGAVKNIQKSSREGLASCNSLVAAEISQGFERQSPRSSSGAESSEQADHSKEVQRREEADRQGQGFVVVRGMIVDAVKKNSLATEDALRRIQKQNEDVLSELKEIRLFMQHFQASAKRTENALSDVKEIRHLLQSFNEQAKQKSLNLGKGENYSIVSVSSDGNNLKDTASGFVSFKVNVGQLSKARALLKSEEVSFYECKWNLRVQRVDEQVGIFLQCGNMKAGCSMDVEYSLMLWSTEKFIERRHFNKFSREFRVWGRSSFVEWSAIMDPNNGFIDKLGDICILSKFTRK